MAAPLHACFDKDGTLTDVHSYWAYTCSLRAKALVERYGLPASREAEILDGLGIAGGKIKRGGPVGYKPRVEIIAELAAKTGLPVDGITETFAELDRKQQASNDFRVAALPGVRETLSALKARGMKLSVYTSDRVENARRSLAMVGLGELFEIVVGGDSVEKPKPDPEGMLIACRHVGVEPARTVYVSDTVDDLLMAKAGGALPIGVASGVLALPELLRRDWVVLREMSELEQALAAAEVP